MSHDPTNPGRESGPARGEASRGGILRHAWLRRLAMALIDLLILSASIGLAYQVGFDFQPERFTPVYIEQLLYVMPVLVLVRLALLHALGLYRGFTRYTGIYELSNIVLACLAGTALLVVFNVATPAIERLGDYPLHSSGEHILRVPWGIVIIDALLAVFGVGGIRLLRRLMGERLIRLRATASRRVLIIGAGDAGEQVARELLKTQVMNYRPVAFIDPDPASHGRRIHGIPVVGGLEDLEAVTGRYQIQMVVIALPKPTPALMRRMIDHFEKARLEFKIIPDLPSMMRGDIQISQLRPVEIEDLLGRPPVVVPSQIENSVLFGRRVLVTGAGGSIGSELCRQTLLHQPRSLTLLGRGENSLYEIHAELRGEAQKAGVELNVWVGDVRDEGLVERLFEETRPQVVLHAAAHKHVHFMEAQPAEAIKNNVMGTRLLAEASLRHGVERFILISTDKAVHPIGVMGASKRVAELIVTALNGVGETRFQAVRFGNVLGSRGSVIPLFRRQIAAGGPVTVTHPEATRYFMTIPEAVSLVLEAARQGEGGEVFMLDMGQPVRILDLARQLIILSGLEPGTDIAIEFVGLRAGEKLHEELMTEQEEKRPTAHEKIYRCPQAARSWEELAVAVEELEGLAKVGDEGGIRAWLKRLIPDYRGDGGAVG